MTWPSNTRQPPGDTKEAIGAKRGLRNTPTVQRRGVMGPGHPGKRRRSKDIPRNVEYPRPSQWHHWARRKRSPSAWTERRLRLPLEKAHLSRDGPPPIDTIAVGPRTPIGSSMVTPFSHRPRNRTCSSRICWNERDRVQSRLGPYGPARLEEGLHCLEACLGFPSSILGLRRNTPGELLDGLPRGTTQQDTTKQRPMGALILSRLHENRVDVGCQSLSLPVVSPSASAMAILPIRPYPCLVRSFSAGQAQAKSPVGSIPRIRVPSMYRQDTTMHAAF